MNQSERLAILHRENPGHSHTPYIVVIIILVLGLLGLGIWLVTRFMRDRRNDKNRTVDIPAAQITANDTAISGSWGNLNNENDKVTLYVSEKPIQVNSDGSVSDSSIQRKHATGSNGTVSVNITKTDDGKTYYAVLVVTGDDTSNYNHFTRTVFTQVQTDVAGKLFNIKSLIDHGSAVSTTATYTSKTSNVGIYRLGSADHPTPDNDHLLVKYDDPSTSTDDVLCRDPTTTNIIFGTFDGTTIKDSDGKDIKKTFCNWTYNKTGLNQWCLTDKQSTNAANPTTTETLCMEGNGTSLSLGNSGVSDDQWFNHIVPST